MLCGPGFTQDEVLQAAASLEQFSKHPLTGAVVQAARDAKLSVLEVSQIREKPGEGLLGIVAGRRVRITGRGKVDSKLLPSLPPSLLDWSALY